MLLLCLSWAFQQIAVKFALPEVGPMSQGALRYTGAALLTVLYMLVRGGRVKWLPGLALPGLAVGLLFGGEFMLLFKALTLTDATRAVMFLYTAPFVVAIGSHFLFPGEALDGRSGLGVILAFAGVALSLAPGGGERDTLAGDLMAIAAGVGWGLTTLVIKGSDLRYAPASQALLYQLGAASLMFIVAALWIGDRLSWPLSGVAIASVAYQMIWVATITFGIWFVLITRYSATSLSVITFVTPIFGAVMGYLFLGESLGPGFVLAVSCVAGGIVLVTLPRRRADERRD
jgi:drug/metabolite transporter (DMT)-like permease